MRFGRSVANHRFWQPASRRSDRERPRVFNHRARSSPFTPTDQSSVEETEKQFTGSAGRMLQDEVLRSIKSSFRLLPSIVQDTAFRVKQFWISACLVATDNLRSWCRDGFPQGFFRILKSVTTYTGGGGGGGRVEEGEQVPAGGTVTKIYSSAGP